MRSLKPPRSRGRPESGLSRVFRKEVFRFSMMVAIIAGSVLNIAVQGEALIKGVDINVVKVLATYFTLYCVATYLALTTRSKLL